MNKLKENHELRESDREDPAIKLKAIASHVVDHDLRSIAFAFAIEFTFCNCVSIAFGPATGTQRTTSRCRRWRRPPKKRKANPKPKNNLIEDKPEEQLPQKKPMVKAKPNDKLIEDMPVKQGAAKEEQPRSAGDITFLDYRRSPPIASTCDVFNRAWATLVDER